MPGTFASLLQKWFRRSVNAPRPVGKWHRLPRLETLEDRTLPSVCIVDRLTDNNPTGGGEGSGMAGDLRWCVVESLFRADTINFSVTGTINLSGALPTLTRSVSIEGPGANLMTVRRDTGGDYRIFTVPGGVTVGISGLTINNGNLATSGGISNAGTLTVSNSIVSGNSGGVGGGGGGVFNNGTMTVSNCTISGNAGNFDGGGISNSGTMTVVSSTISGNTGSYSGGIYNRNSGTLTVSNCTISGNAGNFGRGAGGIYNNGTMTVSNSTISGNSGSTGGISTGRTLTVVSSTISGNTGNTGGGIYGPGGMTTRNTIIAGNTAPTGPDVYGNLGSQGYNLIGNPQDMSGWVGTDLLHVNPLLGPFQNNGGPTFTRALLAGSPALNAGDSTQLGMPDQRGVVRSGGVNIGAFQASAGALAFTGLPGTVTAGAPQTVTVTARDRFGQTAVGYHGTLHFTSTDLQAVLPSDYPFTLTDAGIHSFSVTLRSVGSQTITATDTASSSVTGSASTNVQGASTTTTGVNSSANPTVYGQVATFTATVTSGGNPVTAGTVTFHEGSTVLASAVPVDGSGHARFMTATLSATASPHAITADYSGAGQYAPSSGSVSQTVNRAPLTVTADNKSKVYGSDNPALTAVYTGFVNGDTAATALTGGLATTATAGSPVGAYPITQGTLAAVNYTITFTPATLTVTPAPLTITADDQTRPYGQPNPTLTVRYAGFVNGDTSAVVSGPTVTTTAATDSPPGAYPITPRGATAANYTITLVNGTLTVTPTGTIVTTLADNGGGSLRAVLGGAPDGATITFAPSVQGTITLTTGELLIRRGVTVQGPGAGLLTVSGNNASRVFEVAAGVSASLSGLTIARGRVSSGTQAQGGGILSAGTLTLTDCTVTNNRASVSLTGTGTETAQAQGGGIYTTGPLSLVRCTVAGNTTALAAGNLDSGQANGGGLYTNGAAVTLTNSTVAGNRSAGTFTGGAGLVFASGGGLTEDNGTLSLTGCTVSGNQVTAGNATGFGGGVHAYNSTVTLTACTVANNTAGSASGDSQGGGVSDLAGSFSLTGCTVTGNAANSRAGSGTGGGVYFDGSAGSFQLDSTIVGGNSSATAGPDASGPFTSLGYNLVGITDGSAGWVGTDQTGTAASPLDPMLGTLGSYGGSTQTIPLLAGSPALNAGDPGQLGTPDQRGAVRTGGVNVGAFQASAAVLVLVAPATAGPGLPFDLMVAVYDAFGQLAVGYTGTVHFSTTDQDPGVVLPLDYTFQVANGGVVTFSAGVTLFTPGDQTLTAADLAAGISGSTVVTL